MNTKSATELVRVISTLDQTLKELSLRQRATELALLRDNPDLKFLIEAEVERLRRQEDAD